MKLSRNVRMVAVFACVAIFLASCSNPAGRDIVLAPIVGFSLRVDAPASSSSANARTLLPSGDLAIATYALSATGPEGAEFSADFSADEVFSRDGLTAGTWTFNLDAKADSDGTVLYSGNASATLVEGQRTEVRIALNPAAGSGMQGIVDFKLSWPSADIATPSASFMIVEADGAPVATPLGAISYSSGQASGNAALAAGDYLVQVRLLDGLQLRFAKSYALQVLNGRTTYLVIDTSPADLNRLDAPAFDLVAGTYEGPQTLAITAEPGAVVYYTLDGSDPFGAVGVIYFAPLDIEASVTVKARALLDGILASETTEMVYAITPFAPSFNQMEGTYIGSVTVSLSTMTPGAAIYYSTDGTDPDVEDSVYSVPIALTTTTTLNAVAVKDGMTDSEVSSAKYTIRTLTPTFSLAGGPYAMDCTISLSCATPASVIHYTTDGNEPTTASPVFSAVSPVTVAGHGTVTIIKAVAISSGTILSNTFSATYTISYPQAATPAFSIAGGTWATDKLAAISCTTPNSAIYYTTDGSIPTSSSPQYSAGNPISVAGHGTVMILNAIALSSVTSLSGIATATYTIAYPAAASPVFSPSEGTFSTDRTITINCSTPGSAIYYTTDGGVPTTGSIRYSEAIPVSGHGTVMTIKAIAISSITSQSVVASATYQISYPPAAVPALDPADGTYATEYLVSMSCATAGSAIYYTTDGSIPTANSSLYTAPFSMIPDGPAIYIKAISTAPGFSSSAVATVTYRKLYDLGSVGPAGGLIFHDKGSFSDGWRYLEAAPDDYQDVLNKWSLSYVLTGANGIGIGSGKSNTSLIVAVLGTNGHSANVCATLVVGGYDDWFLPSKDELNLMYVNLKLPGLDVFSTWGYWSSSEYDENNVWGQSFTDGTQFNSPKYFSSSVRAIRAF